MSASQLRSEIQYGLQNLLHTKPFFPFKSCEISPSYASIQKNTTELIAELFSLTRSEKKTQSTSHRSRETVPLNEHLAPRHIVSSSQVSLEREPDKSNYEFNKEPVNCYCTRCSQKQFLPTLDLLPVPPRGFKNNVMTFRDECVMTSCPKDAVVEVNSSEMTPILHSKHTFIEALKKCNLIYCKSKQTLNKADSIQGKKEQESQKCGCLNSLRKDENSGLLNVFYPSKHKEGTYRKLPTLRPTLSGTNLQNDYNTLFNHNKRTEFAGQATVELKHVPKDPSKNSGGSQKITLDAKSSPIKRPYSATLNEKERRRLVKYSAWGTLFPPPSKGSRHTVHDVAVEPDQHCFITQNHRKSSHPSNIKWSNENTPTSAKKRSNLKSVSSNTSTNKRTKRLSRPIEAVLESYKSKYSYRGDESFSNTIQKKKKKSTGVESHTSKCKSGSCTVRWRRQCGRSDSVSTSAASPRSASPRSVSACRTRPVECDNWIPYAHGPQSMYHNHCYTSDPREKPALKPERSVKLDKVTNKVEKSRIKLENTSKQSASTKSAKSKLDKFPTKLEKLPAQFEKFHSRRSSRY